MIPNYIQKSMKAWFEKNPRATFYERIDLFQEGWKLFGSESYARRYGKVLSHMLNNMSVVIRDEELLVGAVKEIIPSKEQRAFAENLVEERWGTATEEQKQEWISFYYSPGWIKRRHPDFFTFGHLAFNWDTLIEKGLGWYIGKAQGILDAGTYKEDEDRISFLEGAVAGYEGISRFIARYAEEAARLAGEATLPEEKARLTEIAALCERITLGPAGSLREALQLIWFITLASQKVAGCGVFCFSRMDQYLLPFYEKDLADGKLTREEALYLIEDFYNKNNDIMDPGDHMSQEDDKVINNLEVTYDDPNYIILGGLLDKETSGVNDLSFLFVQAAHEMGLRNPWLVIRYHDGIDNEFWKAVADSMRSNSSVTIYNDDTMIPALLKYEVEEEDVYEYGFFGCNDPLIPCEEGGLRQMWVTLPWPVELAINGGQPFMNPQDIPEGNFTLKDRLIGLMYGPFKGVESSLTDIKSMDDFLELYRANLSLLMRQYREGMEQDYQVEKKCSRGKIRIEDLFLNGTIDAAECWITGGVKYHKIIMQGSGFSTAVDSLAAINKAVFVDKRYTLSELRDAMAANYEGYEELHSYVKSLPKYGNDDREADQFAAKVTDIFCDVMEEMNRERKGLYTYMPTISTDRDFTMQGSKMGASADGRLAGEAVGENQSPAAGADQNGITALLNSASAIPFDRITGGPLNVMLHPSTVENEEGLEKLASLFRAFMKKGGMQLQLNVVGHDELIKAQQNPDQYKTLCVRVTGYSAYFVQMGKVAQDEMIHRTVNF
ncbi:MAG: pyruvate formate lyase family protein [Spirochaetales bacterium]|nr:pyruvate formate lyase family protein [Spirochaetales bacterium]